MPSVAVTYPWQMVPGRKRRRDVNDANDLQIQSPLYEKLAQYHSTAATNNWSADSVFGGRPVQQQIQQQQQQQQQNFFSRFPGSNNDRMIFQHGFVGADDHHHSLDAVPRRIAPLPVSKRQRMFDDEDADLDSLDGTLSPHDRQTQRRHSKSPPASTQQQRQHSRALQDQSDAAGNRPKTPSSLSPCHICHRRPTKKSDLDSFADCQGCGQRSCFVCIRECQGWQKDGRPSSGGTCNDADQGQEQEGGISRSFHMDDVDDDRQRQSKEEGKGSGQAKIQAGWTGGAHGQMVCSRCCIEKGAEGDVVCLGCLSRMESI
ncbi:hypothetical protein EsH8_I_000927 [Colletotrichum jinshuiense]